MLLVLWAGGAVAHYCFDGLEEPVSVHFDSLNGHDDHSDESGHVDIEKPAVPVNLITKIFELETGIIPVALLLLCLLSLTCNSSFVEIQTQLPRFVRAAFPPLRAPPQYSC